MVCTFDINKPDDRVEYDIWLTASNPKGIKFVADFKAFNDKLGMKVKMTPRYFTWACTSCDAAIMEQDCVCAGEYCALDEENLVAPGKDIIAENLRQRCIFEQGAEFWWDYVTEYRTTCISDFSEKCSK